MQASLIHRSFAFCLSAAITLAVLGGIDYLAQPDEGSAGWAQKNQVVAPRA